MRSHFVAVPVPMSVLQPVYSEATSPSSRLKTLTNLHLRRVTSPVLPPSDPPDPPDPPNLPSSLTGSPRRSLTSISNPPSLNSAQIPSFPRSSSIISIPTGSCRAVHCCCSGECYVSALTCLASHSCCSGHVMVEAQVVPLEPPDPSSPDVSLLLQMQPLARALTFSAVCAFSDTSISSLPWPQLNFEANSVTLLSSLVLDFGFLCGLLTVDCSFFSGFLPVLSSAIISATCVLKDLRQVHMIWEYMLADLVKRVGWNKKYILTLIVAHVIVFRGDVLMDLASFGSTFVSSSDIYVALVRSLTAVCSPLMIFIPAVGVVFCFFSPWWRVDEKPIVIFSPMNMIVASYDVPIVSYLEQSHFPIFPLIWSEVDEQVSLVLQGSSSH